MSQGNEISRRYKGPGNNTPYVPSWCFDNADAASDQAALDPTRPSHGPSRIEQIKQQIKDLFAVNTNDYTPTFREVENINNGLNQILASVLNPSGRIFNIFLWKDGSIHSFAKDNSSEFIKVKRNPTIGQMRTPEIIIHGFELLLLIAIYLELRLNT